VIKPIVAEPLENPVKPGFLFAPSVEALSIRFHNPATHELDHYLGTGPGTSQGCWSRKTMLLEIEREVTEQIGDDV
jgi:hypothetical protein